MNAFFKWLRGLFGNTKETAVAAQQPMVVLDKPIPPGKGIKWYPKSVIAPKEMRTRGRYKKGYPEGAVVHFTAGRYEGGVKKALSSIEGGIDNGYTFLCIGTDGKVVQAHPVDRWGYHAGSSAWKGLTDSVSDELIGIEINNAGKVTKEKDGRFKTWFKTYLEADEVRYVTQEKYGCPTGYYHKFTPAQEEALIDLLVWLKQNDDKGVFQVKYILGHHEVSGLKGIGKFRKNDPGGALSMTMDQLRLAVQKRLDNK